MAAGTFKLPSGTTFRSQSNRRFVVVTEYVPGKATILYRTDNVGNAVQRVKNLANNRVTATIVDTVGHKVRTNDPVSSRPGFGPAFKWVDA